MKTTPITSADLSRSVIAVPPLARRADLSLDRDANRALIRHLEAGGVRSLMYGGNASALITGLTVTLTPYEAADLSIVWRCGYSAAPAGLSELGTANGGNKSAYVTPTVPFQYLPSTCRL